MIKFLVKKFIKDYENTADSIVRERYTLLSGILGIICNAFLFALKIIIGTVSGSIAITSDAFNNLSDMGMSIVSIFSAKLSNKHADKDHPFGYGKVEYVASLIVSLVILLVGFELLKSSVNGIIHPEAVKMTIPLIIILTLSILVKVWMFLYNRYLGRKTNSSLLEATSKDSLSDCISTAAVILASALVLIFPNVPFDGIFGVLVSLLILWNGFKMALEVVNLIIGGPADPEIVAEIENRVLSGKDILGVHDLIVHDYGPGRVFASCHAEVPYNGNVLEMHENIDMIESAVKNDLHIMLVIHMDPVVHDSPRVNALKELTTNIAKEINESFTIHDFRITDGEKWTNLIFDMVVGPEVRAEKRQEYVDYVNKRLKEEDETLHAVITVE